MKKLALIFFSALIISAVHLNAYVNKRYTWWNMRIKRLEKLLVNINSNKLTDNSVKSLIKKDIETGRDFIAFHNRRIYQNLEIVKDPGSLSMPSVKKEIEKIIYPIAAFHELDELLKRAGSFETVKDVKKSVWNEIEKIMKEQAGISDKEAAYLIRSFLVQKNELKMLSMEIVLSMRLNNVEMRIKKIVEALTGTVIFKIKNKEVNLDPVDFYMRTTEWAIDTCSAAGSREYMSDLKDALKRSWKWKQINEKLLKLIEEKKRGLFGISSSGKISADLIKRINNINLELKQLYITGSPLLLKEYSIRFKTIAMLMKKIASAGINNYPYLEGRINGIYRRILDIYRYLVSIPGESKEKINGVPDELSERYHVGEKRYSEGIKQIKKSIDESYRLISGRISAYKKKVKRLGKSIEKYTAQQELNLITTLIEDYSKAFGKYNYESEILNRYSDEFKRLKKQIKRKEYISVFKHFNGEFSLLKTIKFNREKLEREKLNREILRKESLRLVASLTYLVKYYKRKRANINYYPAPEYILQLKNRFKGYRGIKIGSWTMTSDNYSVVDRNVSALFKKIFSRTSWLGAGKKKKHNETGTFCSLSLGSVQFSLNIPHGWFEENLTESDKSIGIIKKFTSIDKKSNINLVKIRSDNRKNIDIKKTGEKWLRLKGMKPVMKKWGKKEKLDYYWILSRDESGAVYEIYTLKRDDYAFILSGETDSLRYSFFRKRLESVFDSIMFRF